MSQIRFFSVIVAVLLISWDIHKADGQISNEDLYCKQCDGRVKFYKQFIKSIMDLQSAFKSCIERCPNLLNTNAATTTTFSLALNQTTATHIRAANILTTSALAPTTTATTPSFECGIQKMATNSHRQRIVGGTRAGECAYPWTVFVTRFEGVCAGAILTKRHILTAGHCVTDKRGIPVQSYGIHVRVGSSSLSLTKVLPIANFTIHPQHDSVNMVNDAAILTLAEDLDFSDCVAPICLPKVGSDPKSADFCVVAGWGSTIYGSQSFVPDLQEVEVPIVDTDICQRSYGQAKVNDRTLCAGDFYSGGRDSCVGDSGAP